MTKGANIPIAADASSVIREAKKVEGALDQVIDSLDQVSDASQDTETATTKDLESIADEGQENASRLERTFREAFDSVKKESKQAGSDIGHDMKKGTKEAEEGSDALKQNAQSNAKEVAASFDGSAQSIADGFQGLAAEAFEGFGPAGVAAGVAAAAGLGLVMSKLDEAKQRAQETAEGIADIAGEVLELDQGQTIRSAEKLTERIKAMATSAEDGSTEFEALQKSAKEAGIGWEDFVRGVAGDAASAKRSLQQIDDQLSPINEQMAQISRQRVYTESQQSAQAQQIRALQTEADQWNELRKQILDANGILDTGSQVARDATKAITGLKDSTLEVTDAQKSFHDAMRGTADPVSTYEEILARKEEAERKTAEATAAATSDASDSWETYKNDVTVTTQDLIDEWNRQAQQAAEFEKNLAIIGANGGQALADELAAKGPEVAGATAAVIAASDPATQKAAIDAHARATGVAMGVAMATGITSQQVTIQNSVDDVAAGVVPPVIPVTIRVDEIDTSLWDDWKPGEKFGRLTATADVGVFTSGARGGQKVS